MCGASTVPMARAAFVAGGAPVYGMLDAFVPFLLFCFSGRGVGELRMNSSLSAPLVLERTSPFFLLLLFSSFAEGLVFLLL